MDAHSPDTRREIVRRVFPDLRYGGDPDLERYFELRKAGRLGEALNLYNGPLRARYPEDAARVLLLRLYRENDPRWLELQDRLVLELGDRLCRRVAANIDALVAPLERADLSNPLKSLAAAEALQRLLPASGDGAIPFLERYAGFARVLKHRVALAERAADLLREYFAMARSDAPGEYDFVARSAALEEKKREEEERRRAARGGKPDSGGRTESYDFIARSEALEERRRKAEEAARSRFFDLSRLEFSAADVERIEIPAGIERREDRVLAYCWKYWKACADPGFERLVFLYSKKYGTRHFDLLRAVKVGRARRFTDDEILTAVSTIVSPSYSYSVSGDLYMQAMWRNYRARLEEAARRQAESAATAELQGGDRAAPRSRAAARPSLPPPAVAPAPRPSARPPQAHPAPERRAVLPEAAALRRTPDFASRPPAFALQDARERAAAQAAESGAAGGAAGAPDNEARSRAAFLASERSDRPDRRAALAAASESAAQGAAWRTATHAGDHGAERSAAFEASRAAGLREELPRLSSRPAAAPADDEPRSRRAHRPEPAAEAAPAAPAAAPAGKSGLKALSGGARKAHGRELLGRREAPEAVPEIAQRAGSVSDRIRKLSGKAYDVYKEIFLARVRDAIHRRLLEGRRGARRFFDSGANEAEDLIYAYLAAHYDDPYMEWEGSEERRSVEALGFDLPSLDPIIEAWYRKL
ncbi:MAG: hypothetical protein JNG85_01335 [Spirochaetaceae bacterium]|nr:hypothetical protein [Spirochaetaceae bacterium]